VICAVRDSRKMEEVAAVEQLLGCVLQPNTQIVMEAGKQLNSILKKPKSIETLFIILHNSQLPEVRQMAGVMLRKKIMGHWGRQSDAIQANIKKSLLEFLTQDSNMAVRRSIANVIGCIARVLLPAGQWPELLEFLFQCTKSPSVDHRELAMDLFETLTENIGEFLRPYFNVLLGIFRQGLQDPDTRVRLASLKAVGALVGWLSTESEVESFKELIPLMLVVISYCVNNDMEDEINRAFEVFDDLAEMVELKAAATITPDIVKLSLEIGANHDVSLSIRKTALTYIEWIVNYRPKTLTKYKLVGPIMQVAIPMCAEEDEDDIEEGELSAHKFASQLIDMCTTKLPNNHTFQPSMDIVSQYVIDVNPAKRRAAITVLSVMAEGCRDKMLQVQYLPHLLNWVYKATQDTDFRVRESAVVCLGHFSKFLMPDIVEHSSSILPLLFNGINDTEERVVKASCYALEAFCGDLSEEEISPFVDGLVQRLAGVLRMTNKTDLQELALAALSSTAMAAGPHFAPHAAGLLPVLVSIMERVDPELIQLRCTATECVGLIAASIGRHNFEPYLQHTVNLALDGCKSQHEELREYTYAFFCNIAELMEEDFKIYLNEILPFVLKSITSEDGFYNPEEEEDDDDVISDDEDSGGRGGYMHVRTAFLQEKAAACHAVGIYAKCTGTFFLENNYVEHVMSAFVNVRDYMHENVRIAVDESEKEILIAYHKSSGVQFLKGAPLSQQPQLHAKVIEFLDTVMNDLLGRVQKDDDKEVVGKACQNIGEIVKELGPRSVEKYMSQVMEIFSMVLNKKSVCQSIEEDLEGEEDEQLEMELIFSAFDMMTDVSRTLSNDMLNYFETICNIIAPYQKSETEDYRSASIALLAELCNAMGNSILPYVPQLINVAFKGMTDDFSEVRSNSTFFCGILLQNAGIAAHSYYPKTLDLLSTLIEDKTLPNITDNTCGALARMINAAPHLLPLQQVLQKMISNLPLKKDMEENDTVYGCLFKLYNSGDQALLSIMPQLISCFARALNSPLEKNIFDQISAILRNIAQQNPTAFEATLHSACSEKERESVMKLFATTA